MIGRLRGVLIEKQAPDILIDVQGVGYEVRVPLTTHYHLPDTGTEVVLYTHFSVSENAQQLFGFIAKRDRTLFRELIKVNGVGPKVALAILSGMEVDVIVRHVMDNNAQALVKVPGVGKKTAERVILELKDRIKKISLEVAVPAPPGSGPEEKIWEDATSALLNLGYPRVQAEKALEAVRRETVPPDSLEEVLRRTLRILSR